MLSFVFFASIAAGADITTMLQVAPLLVLFVLILLATHLLCLLVVGRWLKPDATRAIDRLQRGRPRCHYRTCNGGSKGWHDQVTPGVLVGVLGCAGHADRQSAFQSALGDGPSPAARPLRWLSLAARGVHRPMVVVGQRSGGSITTRGNCTLHPAIPTSREITPCKHAGGRRVGQLIKSFIGKPAHRGHQASHATEVAIAPRMATVMRAILFKC